MNFLKIMTPLKSKPTSYLLKVGLLAALYFFTAKLGLSLGAINGVATAVWPPSGISLAALLILGIEYWPGIALGAFLANWLGGIPWGVALGISFGNTLEALLGSYLLIRFIHFKNSLERLIDVIGLIFLAAFLSTLVSATLGTTSSWLGKVIPSSNFFAAGWTWWIGDMMGDLIVAPVLLTWSIGSKFRFKWMRILEGSLLFILLGVVSEMIFYNQFIFNKLPYPHTFVIFPFLIWAALRFGPRETTATTLCISFIALWHTLHSSGPFVQESLLQSLILLQIFMGILAITSMILSATMSQRNRAEESLKQRSEELERSNKELEHFAYIASHDLQEPLYIVAGFTDTIKEQLGSQLNPDTVFLLERIQNATHRMGNLIRDLLQFARVNIQKKPFELVDLNSVIQDVLVELEMRVQEAHATIQVEKLPKIYGDKIQMIQLFQNLISNSLKFRQKEIPSQIKIKATSSGKHVAQIIIQDNGIGFEQEYSNKILEPFQRLHGRGEYEGSGLGLAICQKIIYRHQGKITATSTPKQGAIFNIYLPLSRLPFTFGEKASH